MLIWNSDISYNPGDQIIYNNLAYECLILNINTTPENKVYWILVWEIDVIYTVSEKVKYNDREYILLNSAPVGTLPTDSIYWNDLNSLIISGDNSEIYDLDDIFVNKDRLSNTVLVIAEEHDNTELGQMMIKDRGTIKLNPNPSILEWTDPSKKR